MIKQLNREMSHNVCYRKLPSREVVYLFGWNLHTECGEYYIRLFRDDTTGLYFYTVRDLSWSLARRIYSVGFCSAKNALLDIRSFVSFYTHCKEVVNSIPLTLKECA